MADVHMLLVYSLESQALVKVEKLSDGDEAMERYAEVEREHLEDASVEIVLVAADSEAAIRLTHASYLRGDVALTAEDLESLLA